jgi:hypothetical protein
VFTLTLILLVIGGTPLAIVLIGVLLAKRERRGLLSAVRALGCPSCSASLSEDSVRVAHKLWERHVATLTQRNPGVMFRLVRKIAAVCDACGARLQFDQDSGTLRPIAIVFSFETGGTDSVGP